MNCSITDLRAKVVVDVQTGCRVGTVFDVLVDTCSGCVIALLVFGGRGFFGFCGKGEEIKVPWNDICVIGDEVILVDRHDPCPPEPYPPHHHHHSSCG